MVAQKPCAPICGPNRSETGADESEQRKALTEALRRHMDWLGPDVKQGVESAMKAIREVVG